MSRQFFQLAGVAVAGGHLEGTEDVRWQGASDGGVLDTDACFPRVEGAFAGFNGGREGGHGGGQCVYAFGLVGGRCG